MTDKPQKRPLTTGLHSSLNARLTEVAMSKGTDLLTRLRMKRIIWLEEAAVLERTARTYERAADDLTQQIARIEAKEAKQL